MTFRFTFTLDSGAEIFKAGGATPEAAAASLMSASRGRHAGKVYRRGDYFYTRRRGFCGVWLVTDFRITGTQLP